MHHIVEGLGRVTHLTNDVALLHHGVPFLLKLVNGATDRLHGVLLRGDA